MSMLVDELLAEVVALLRREGRISYRYEVLGAGPLRTRLAEAHKLLTEIYGWFTEGFGTKALQEAKALLGELA